MRNDPKIYGVIVEWKVEQPLIMESRPLTYEEACTRMQELARQANVIRVGVFKIIYVIGNENIIEKEIA